MPQLNNEDSVTASGKKGVNIKAVSDQVYAGSVVVGKLHPSPERQSSVVMNADTDEDKDLGKGQYSVTNNSGGTIDYTWL